MPRPIWKGAITFGMISIPVKLYGATESKDLAFNTLHVECKSRLRQKRWCPVHDREVSADEVVRAYEYSKDNYVEITDEDLEQLPIPSKHTIELSAFVKQSEIDPVYYERTYYLEPEQVDQPVGHRQLLLRDQHIRRRLFLLGADLVRVEERFEHQ